MAKFEIGDLVTNGDQAGVVREIVARDPRWKTSGVRVEKVRTEEYGGNPGTTEFVPDYLSWRLAPTEWTDRPGGQTQERYVWRCSDYTVLCREVRVTPVR